MVDATKVEKDGPILLGANKLLYTSSNLVLATKLKTMEVLIMFIVIAIGFAWAWPEEEIEELDKRLGKKK
jgi:hypothetical protein